MIVETRVFELCHQRYRSLAELAQAMEISVSQVYRVREGKRHINQKFIVGAIKAFPGHRLDDLFYLAPDSSVVTRHYGHRYLMAHSRDKPALKSVLGADDTVGQRSYPQGTSIY